MKRIIYILSLSILVAACNKSNKQISNSPDETELSFITKEYKKEVRLKAGQKTSVVADIPVAEGESVVAEDINNTVFKTIKLIINQEDKSLNYDDLFLGFINNYEKFISENPDYLMGWNAKIRGTVEYRVPELINIKIESYTMMGGPHGNSNNTSLLFDPKTGAEMNIRDIIKDTNSLTDIAEKKFREKFDIPVGKPINSTGLMFKNNKFTLPQNIFVNENGLSLFYNAYEIAAYAEGTRELLIPYEDVKDNLLLKLK